MLTKVLRCKDRRMRNSELCIFKETKVAFQVLEEVAVEIDNEIVTICRPGIWYYGKAKLKNGNIICTTYTNNSTGLDNNYEILQDIISEIEVLKI